MALYTIVYILTGLPIMKHSELILDCTVDILNVSMRHVPRNASCIDAAITTPARVPSAGGRNVSRQNRSLETTTVATMAVVVFFDAPVAAITQTWFKKRHLSHWLSCRV